MLEQALGAARTKSPSSERLETSAFDPMRLVYVEPHAKRSLIVRAFWRNRRNAYVWQHVQFPADRARTQPTGLRSVAAEHFCRGNAGFLKARTAGFELLLRLSRPNFGAKCRWRSRVPACWTTWSLSRSCVETKG